MGKLDFEKLSRQPLMIRVENFSNQKKQVRLFDEEYNQTDIQISSNTPGISYLEMIRGLQNKVDAMGIAFMQCAFLDMIHEEERDFKKILESADFKVTTKEIGGIICQVPITLAMADDQHQKTVVQKEVNFCFGLLTYFSFEMPPECVMTFDFYPKIELRKPSIEKKEAIPYEIFVSNISDETQTVTLFDPEYKNEFVEIKGNELLDISYKDLMGLINYQPFTVQPMSVQCKSISPVEINVTGIREVILTSKDSQGVRIDRTLHAKHDPFGEVENLFEYTNLFRLDQITRLTFKIGSRELAHFKLYPGPR